MDTADDLVRFLAWQTKTLLEREGFGFEHLPSISLANDERSAGLLPLRPGATTELARSTDANESRSA